MYYLLLEVTTYNNNTPKSKGMYEYDTLEQATASFHKKMGGAMSNATYESELVKIITSDGIDCRTEYWERSHEGEESSTN